MTQRRIHQHVGPSTVYIIFLFSLARLFLNFVMASLGRIRVRLYRSAARVLSVSVNGDRSRCAFLPVPSRLIALAGHLRRDRRLFTTNIRSIVNINGVT